MSLKNFSSGSPDFALHPTGMVAARCTRMIDLGTQPQKNGKTGEVDHKQKLMLQFESSVLMEGGKFDGQPYLVGQRYTASMHEKATLRKDLESWRGRKFTQAEIENFPGLKTVLGKPCMLNVVHSDDGKHANIGAVLPLPAGMTAPPAVGKQVYLSLDEDFDPDLFNALSDNLKKTISASPEYQQLMTGGRNPAPSTGSDPQDDDIPF